ncbi:MAG: pirin family protein [Candidatus Obscuribacterales bacterium]|nr:pirin family protein [Candidatus Obscuribacterales bacterium]
MRTKRVVSLHEPHAPHMVGDGLPVRNLFSYRDLGKDSLSPFLLLDYGSPSNFPPTEKALGVGMHPHRGFETVTFVFQGGLQHRDTAGNFGEIGPGDVQWMTAGKGVLHEELHSAAFRKIGGTLQMVQLWVNLPAEHKMTPPKYQTLLSNAIPRLTTADESASVRVVAGSFETLAGPAETFTPVNLLDIEFHKSGKLSVPLKSGYTTALFVMHGAVTVGGTKLENGIHLAILERENEIAEIESFGKAHLLLLNGKPIDEPVVGYGPFVMNSDTEIAQAMRDYQSGRFAAIS